MTRKTAPVPPSLPTEPLPTEPEPRPARTAPGGPPGRAPVPRPPGPRRPTGEPPRPDETPDFVEMIALIPYRTAVRGRSLTGGAVTWRRTVTGVVAGQVLRIRPTSIWTWRRTRMVGGRLVHAGFSLSALRRAGFRLPELIDGGLRCPGDDDVRLAEATFEARRDQPAAASGLLVQLLGDHPTCLPAHALLGDLNAEVAHVETAVGHYTAAIRLGLAAMGERTAPPPGGPARPPSTRPDSRLQPLAPPAEANERAWLAALVGRGRLHAEAGRTSLAAADLRRVLHRDPDDALGAGQALARLETAPP